MHICMSQPTHVVICQGNNPAIWQHERYTDNYSRFRVTHYGPLFSGWVSYRKISWSIEAARLGFRLFQSLWNLTGISAAVLPRCLSNFRAMRSSKHPISRLRDFTRFCGKTSNRLVNKGPDNHKTFTFTFDGQHSMISLGTDLIISEYSVFSTITVERIRNHQRSKLRLL